MNAICSLKPLVPMSSTSIRERMLPLTITSQVLVLSSDLRSVRICRDALPLLPIKACWIISVCPKMNPNRKNSANFWGGVFDFFKGWGGCSI